MKQTSDRRQISHAFVCIMHLYLNRLQLSPLGPGTLMRMNDIVFAFIFQITIQHEHPDLTSYIGASLVMSCTAGMGLNKWRLEKRRVAQEKLREQQDESDSQTTP